MNDEVNQIQPVTPGTDLGDRADTVSDDIARLHSDFQSRLLAASLRAEAIRAGMVDLDGLKLLDVSTVQLDHDDTVIGGRKLMDNLKVKKPWLFATASSSSAAKAPAAQPPRQKSALEMTDEEYVFARAAVTKYQF